jgi:hypothetical protein
MGSLLVTLGHALLGQHPGQSGMLVVHLALRPLAAFGLDDRAKVSAFTSGADPRSTGRPPYLHQWAHPRPHQERCARAAGPLDWASRERITLPSTVGGDLGKRPAAQRFPAVC